MPVSLVDYILNNYNAKLLFTDTDSLAYEISSKDAYEQCFKDKDLFDFSGYPLNSKYYDSSKEKISGKMKDEFNGFKIVEFVGLKSKMYSSISVDNREVCKAKGVNKKLRCKEYLDVCSIKKLLDII